MLIVGSSACIPKLVFTSFLYYLAFGESTDGTTVRGITQESISITLPVPTYAPGVDDSDKSTHTSTIRFGNVASAIDHTAKTQLEGCIEFGEKIASAYSNSPIAARDGVKMTGDDYFRKQNFQNMDHAADGILKFKLTDIHKQNIVQEDLGRAKMDNMTAFDLVTAATAITDAEIQKELKSGEEL